MRRLIFFVSLAATTTLTSMAVAAPRVEDVAVLLQGPGGFEALDQAKDGSIFLTYTRESKVFKITPDGRKLAEIALPLHPQVAILLPNGGFVTTGHEQLPDFGARQGGGTPSFKGLGTALLLVDKNGKVNWTFKGPEDAFFNGIAQAGPNTFIIADTIGGRLWRADIKKRVVESWLADPSIEGPGGRGSFGGSNGIKIHDGWVYFTSRGGLWRVQIGKDGRPVGKPDKFADIAGDDFDIAHDGAIYMPSGKTLMRISPKGEISEVAKLGVGAPTAMLSKDERSVFIPTRGTQPGAPPGPPVRLLRVWLGS